MENLTTIKTETSTLFALELDTEVRTYLGESARWAKFLSIMGFIFCGLFIVVALLAGSLFASLYGLSAANGTGLSGSGMGTFVTLIYLGLAVLYFFPCLFLFRFAAKMQLALRNDDQAQLGQSFKNMRSLYRFLGILMVVGIGIWVVSLLLVAAFSGIKTLGR